MAPIKRHEALKPLSREHHHTLLLVWKIKNGLKKNVSVERIKKYCDWYFKEHLQHHFAIEEKELVKILGEENVFFQQMKNEHRHIEQLFLQEPNKTLYENVAEALEKHIRFEERTVFQKVQEVATEEELKEFSLHHTENKFVENTSDEFWI